MTETQALQTYKKVIALALPIGHLRSISETLSWDQEVVMPSGASAQRGEEAATLQSIIQQKLMERELRETLAEAQAVLGSLNPTQQADIRELQRLSDRATKIPPALLQEIARLEVTSVPLWLEARKKNDISIFLPALKRLIECKKSYADALSSDASLSRYDILLQDYEIGEDSASLEALFQPLRDALTQQLSRLMASSSPPQPTLLQGSFPRPLQESYIRAILPHLGYSFEHGRLDTSTHPFCSGTGADVRITTRYDEADFTDALFSCVHEVGHALYEQALPRERYAYPANVAASMGIHESQSRLWENMIARSLPFWEYFYPSLQETFPHFKGISLLDFWRAVNVVQPSLIRTQADEVTYNLHIILRFDLERQLLHDQLDPSDLIACWNERMKSDLGVLPNHLAEGALQDIHWASGLFGYFPTYALGNLYAAQWLEQIRKDLPNLDALLRQGELLPLREWLRKNIHECARTLYPRQICEKVTQRSLSIQPFVDYLSQKYEQVYFS